MKCSVIFASALLILTASTSRLRGSVVVSSELMSLYAAEVTSTTARLNAFSFAFDG